MKKVLYILFPIVALWLMTGCAHREEMDISGGASPDAVPVEFQFSSTKAMISGVSDIGNKAAFGMFAVNNALYSDPEGDLAASDGLDLRNELCTFVAQTSSSPAHLQFGYDNRKFYYPMNTDVSYSFYTYHKWNSATPQTVSEMSSSKRQMRVMMEVASVNDVIYSETASVDENGVKKMEEFNSDIVRKTGKVPTFRMRHPVAGVRVKVVLHPDSRMTIHKMDDFTILNMSYTNSTGAIPVKAALCIVDLDNPDNNGRFVETVATASARAWKTADNSTGNLNIDLLQDKDGDGVTSCLDTPELVGGEQFIAPQDDHLVVTMTFDHRRYNASGGITGNWPDIQRSVDLDPSQFGADAGYKAGKLYSYVINVKYINPTGNPYDDDVELTVEADYEE